MRIIDTHQHLWDRTRFDLPWLASATEPLSKSHTPDDYAQAAAGLGIAATIYMEVDVRSDQREAEAQYVFGLCDDPKNPMVGAVVGGDPAAADFKAYLDKIASPHLKGVRQVLHGGLPQGYCLSPEFVAGVRELGKRKLRFDLCLRSGELADGAALAKKCPETRFVLDHCGNAPITGTAAQQEAWKRGLEQVAACSNTVVKISGIIAGTTSGVPFAEQLAPSLNQTLDAFGPERVIFASDWPVCTLRVSLKDWITTLKALVATRSEAEQRKLFYDNATRFYEL
ncbi:amidohydrolase family protein [Armatimonas sp.]|uniref:amidohydrolase family protein n=1 Tax=Armatimonas sp. TaxID=1872638 RepID=UPI00374C8FB0